MSKKTIDQYLHPFPQEPHRLVAYELYMLEISEHQNFTDLVASRIKKEQELYHALPLYPSKL